MSRFPSSREMVLASRLKAPAWVLVLPAASVGVKGSGFRHGPTSGQDVTLDVVEALTAADSGHGVRRAGSCRDHGGGRCRKRRARRRESRRP
jgi:hypothetical protein